MRHIADENVKAYHKSNSVKYRKSVSGYGSKIPTRYQLTLQDGRTRRVYVDVYGNGGGTPYVMVKGEPIRLSADVESMLESM